LSETNPTTDLDAVSVISTAIQVDYYRDRCGQAGLARPPASAREAAEHYLGVGAEAGIDPAVWFDATFYLDANPDVQAAGVNPFEHYLRHGRFENRHPLPNVGDLHGSVNFEQLDPEVAEAARSLPIAEFKSRYGRRLAGKLPLVTVIVPNYNHAEFLPERLDSILSQSYPNMEILVLDDCSTDNSRKVIEGYSGDHPDVITFVPNETNSGNVFRQWRKGFEMARGDLVWICESDDTAELDFLDLMVPLFDDLAVNLAFCRVQFIDELGREMKGLDGYRERAKAGFWGQDQIHPAAWWFAEPFSVHNVIPNVGGCLLRRQPVDADIWEQASEYKVLGDWFLYLSLARGGKIAYKATATTYFRQHGRNTSVESFADAAYYREHQRLAVAIRRTWAVPDETTWRFYRQLRDQFEHCAGGDTATSIFDYISIDRLCTTERAVGHVLMGFLGFHVGGGEYFPIYLANALRELGVQVSMLALDTVHVTPEMFDLLDRRIPVYSAADVNANGPEAFLSETGVDIVHSNHIGIEHLFFSRNELEEPFPFVASLHGTYEVSGLQEYEISRVTRGVRHWVYTADKNTEHLRRRPWVTAPTTKLPNAVPINNAPWETTRNDLGVGENTFVFTLVSRPMRDKGWHVAAQATAELLDEGHDVALWLVGDGDYRETMEARWGNHPAIRFLGFQSNIHGIFRQSNCCLLPTRFKGESYPLILVQAIQSTVPSIATDAGEIAAMLVDEESSAGILVPWVDDDQNYTHHLKRAMQDMLDPSTCEPLVLGAKKRADTYSMEVLARRYLDLYEQTVRATRAEPGTAIGPTTLLVRQ
jgi:glycosyltransferase involved in cell wall biosynthesis